ncbi:WSC domain-containing protein [Cladobotryum mycophilum]|uniref:WSC domain-containing protein n=1 Tax=Cladobotryum mycophilum TaxID=491253 RepID=A0ABR0SB70_9HYPO
MGLGTLFFAAIVGLANGLGSTDTITWGGDNSRSGYQTTHNMDPSVVGSPQFGQLFKTVLPGNYGGNPEQIFSQPLVYTPSGGTKQYVYVATTQNNVYKLDAKTGEIIASRSLHIPFLSADLDGCVDINPSIGVTSTGVIDPDTETLYLTSKTYADQTILNSAQGRPAGRYYLHALNVNDLSERPNFPVDLEGTIARNNPDRMFTGGIHHQRPALLHTGQYIYAGFASHCVQYNFTGWIMGWDKTSGQTVEKYAMEGKGVANSISGGGMWMSGGGIASDDAGSIWFATGNGYASQLANVPVKGYSPPTSLEEAAVHMTVNSDGSLNLVDFFMPWEKQALDGADKDLGTSPLEILPGEFSCGDIKRIGVVTGKSGKTYWLNLDNLGGYRNGADGLDDVIQVYQNDNSVYAGAGVYPLEGGYVYINVIQHPSNVFKFSCDGGKPSFTKVGESPASNAYILGVSHGTTTSLNGQPGTGLLWVTDVQGVNLRIYNAVPKNGKLNMINSFNIPGVMKFYRPVFGDGIVYIGTNQGFLYGYGSPVNSPINCTTPIEFGNVSIKATSDAKPVTCTALIDVTVTDVGLDASTDYGVSDIPTLPLQLAKGSSFTVQAKFHPTSVGLLSNDVVVNTTNSIAGYSVNTHARLTGTGQSADALLSISPNTITYQGVVVGNDPNGVTESLILNNLGNADLTIQSVMYSSVSAKGPWQYWNGTGNLAVGKFTLQKLPSTIAANAGSTVSVLFDTSVAGTYSAFLTFVSTGGNGSVSIAGSAGPAPQALLEFQTPDGSDWVQYKEGTPFTFGNVTENNARALKFRITNNSTEGGVNLSLTVSKPPFGVAGLIRAQNQVDLAEGTSLAPGESANATLTCAAPKSQWNVNPTNGTAQWTLNTNDPKLGKQFIQFYCNAVSEQAAPLLDNGLGQYRYIGCYKDNNPARQLSNQIYGNDNNTNPMCIQACAENKYVFCASQYHTECWGGNTIPNLKVDDANCNYYCNGDINQVCGGNGDGTAAYMSLFADTLQFDGNTTAPLHLLPVVLLSTLAALPNFAATDKKTVAQCVDACKSSKNIYAGVEYGGECWCGDKFSDGAVSAPDADCNMACNDNSTEYCGGPSRLNVYKLNTTLPDSPTTTTTPPDSTVTPTTTPTPTGPVLKATVGDYKFQGCWAEPDGARALNDNFYANDTMTLETCADFCSGYTYFGVEYGRECYCGKTLNDVSKKADNQDDCSFPCAGDSTELCGAGVRLQLYKNDAIPTTTTTTAPSDPTATDPSTTTTDTPPSTPTPTVIEPVIYQGNSNFTYYSCVSEPSEGKLMEQQVYNNDTTMTPEVCLEKCYQYKYAGIEYGQECWCGNTLGLAGWEGATPGKNVTDSDCNMLCPGNSTEYCGSGSRLQLYISKNATLSKRLWS